VTKQYAELCKQSRVTIVTRDRWGKEWVQSTWRGTGCAYVQSSLAKSDIYLEVIPLFFRGRIRLPDHPKLLRKLRLLHLQRHGGAANPSITPGATTTILPTRCVACCAGCQIITAIGSTCLIQIFAMKMRRRSPPGKDLNCQMCRYTTATWQLISQQQTFVRALAYNPIRGPQTS